MAIKATIIVNTITILTIMTNNKILYNYNDNDNNGVEDIKVRCRKFLLSQTNRFASMSDSYRSDVRYLGSAGPMGKNGRCVNWQNLKFPPASESVFSHLKECLCHILRNRLQCYLNSVRSL